MIKLDPLSAEVREHAERNGQNLHEVAQLLGVAQSPIDELKPWLRPEAKAKAAARQADANADAAINLKLRAFDRYCGDISEARVITSDIEAGEQSMRVAAETVANAQEMFNQWPRYVREGRPAMTQGAIMDLLIAREIVSLMPKSIEALRAKLAETNKSILAAERKFGFTKD